MSVSAFCGVRSPRKGIAFDGLYFELAQKRAFIQTDGCFCDEAAFFCKSPVCDNKEKVYTVFIC